jgi:hypothetical protein
MLPTQTLTLPNIALQHKPMRQPNRQPLNRQRVLALINFP